jgi:hypothetical protein
MPEKELPGGEVYGCPWSVLWHHQSRNLDRTLQDLFLHAFLYILYSFLLIAKKI